MECNFMKKILKEIIKENENIPSDLIKREIIKSKNINQKTNLFYL